MKMPKQITIHMWRGLVDKVTGLPSGKYYYTDDKDSLEELTKEQKAFRSKQYLDKNVMVIIVKRGVVEQVLKVPSGYKYKIIDKD